MSTQSSTPDTSTNTRAAFETSEGSDTSWSMDVGAEGSRPETLKESANQSAEWDEGSDEAQDPEAGDQEQQQQPEGDDAQEGEDQSPESDAEPLPEYDPDNEEVVKQYEEAYYKDGKLNQEALTKEFWANHGKDPDKPGLNEGTYKYLEALGLDRDMVKSVEAGQLALFQSQQREADRAFFSKVEGGKAGFEAAFAWAQGEGGYDKDMKERFNKALAAGGSEYEEAVDSLMARFKRAGGVIPGGRHDRNKGRRPGGLRRSSSPSRTASGQGAAGAGSGGAPGDVFENRAAYVSAWKDVLNAESEARRSGDKEAIRKAVADRDAVRAKVRRSPRWSRDAQ